jgi:hypothetical protein
VTLSFEQAFIEVWRQTLVENAKVVELGADRFPVKDTPKRRMRQVHVRGQRDSRAGTEPPDQIPVGADGTVRQESDAVPQRGTLRGERGRWQGNSLR